MAIGLAPYEFPRETWTHTDDIPKAVKDALALFALSQADDVEARRVPELDDEALLRLYDDIAVSSMIMAHNAGSLAGVGVYHHKKDSRTGEPITFIEGVAVHPSQQYKGIGTALVSYIANEAMKQGSVALSAQAQPSSLHPDIRMITKATGVSPDVAQGKSFHHLSVPLHR